MWGYCFVSRSSICCGDILGPGKWRGAGRLILAACDGGLNLVGFSKTLGLRTGAGAVEEAYLYPSSCFRVTYNGLPMPREL